MTDEAKQTMVDTLTKIAKDWGIFAAFCCVFIYWNQVDKTQLNARIDQQQQFIQTQLLDKLEKCTIALEAVARTNRMNTEELHQIRKETVEK